MFDLFCIILSFIKRSFALSMFGAIMPFDCFSSTLWIKTISRDRFHIRILINEFETKIFDEISGRFISAFIKCIRDFRR